MAALFLSAAPGFSLGFDPYAGPKPIIVVIETNPWLMVIGSDTPVLAIYENGLVIQKIRTGNYTKPVTTVLTKEQLGEITGKFLQLLGKQKIDKDYDLAPGVTDLPETKIYASIGDYQVATSIYGLFQSDENVLGYTVGPTDKTTDSVPRSLLDTYRYLRSLEFDNTTDWIPAYFEVLAWDYSYAPDQSIVWPESWPDLESGSAAKRGNSYSIFLKGELLPNFAGFIGTRKEKGAVLISGKKLAVSWKYAFPGEPEWRKALR